MNKQPKPKGKIIEVSLALKGQENLIEEAMFQALDVMKSVQKDLVIAPTIGGIAFVFKKGHSPVLRIIYSREEIMKMDFDKVELKSFVDNAYEFKATSLLSREVRKIHQQLRGEC